MPAPTEILAHAVRHHEAGRLVEAQACYRLATRIAPDLAAAHAGLASLLFAQQSYAEAERCCREALRLEPESSASLNNLATVLMKLGRIEEAESAARQALEFDGQNAGAHNNLANVQLEQDRPEEAEATARQALQSAPDNADLRVTLGAALHAQLRLDEARRMYEAVLRDDPQHAVARMNRAVVLLLSGAWELGWKEYEARSQAGGSVPPDFPQPVWEGEPLLGRRILLHSEEGLGDTLHFLRYAAMVRQQGGYVLAECPSKLVRLARTVTGVDQVVLRGATLPDFEVHAPLLSLPRIFATTLKTIPGRAPYLAAHPKLCRFWEERLSSTTGLKVGIAWCGNPNQKNDRRRSLDPALLAPLAEIPNVTLFALHPGPAPSGIQELSPDSSNVDHTAAMMMNLDLVITVDTMAAHLAGALARPVWTLLAYVPDFRWLLVREDTPWYQTMRLFRQPARGDWASVIEHVARELASQCPR